MVLWMQTWLGSRSTRRTPVKRYTAIARPSCGLINHDVVAAVGGDARRNEDHGPGGSITAF
jgi:hypothetical protein